MSASGKVSPECTTLKGVVVYLAKNFTDVIVSG